MKVDPLLASILKTYGGELAGTDIPVIIKSSKKVVHSAPRAFLDFTAAFSILSDSHLQPDKFENLDVIPEEISSEYNTISMDVPARNIEKLNEIEGIERVSMVRWREAYMDDVPSLIEAVIPHSNGLSGEGVKIGVVDSGIDEDHDHFDGKIISYKNFVTTSGESTEDKCGHGTHVAGIAVGNDDLYKSIAPNAKLVVAKTLNSEGRGREEWVRDGIDYAVKEGAQIINLSLGSLPSKSVQIPLPHVVYPGPPFCYPEELSEDEKAVMRAVKKGVVVVCAAGNEGNKFGNAKKGIIGSPARLDHVITVGALTKDKDLAPYSSQGPVYVGPDDVITDIYIEMFQRVEQNGQKEDKSDIVEKYKKQLRIVEKPDVVAIGGTYDKEDKSCVYSTSVFSAFSKDSRTPCQRMPDIICPKKGTLACIRENSSSKFIGNMGTSMAAPQVTGFVALYTQKNNTTMGSKDFVLNSCIKINGLNPFQQGKGLIDLSKL